MNPSKDLVAASSIPLVLSILTRGDSYGYEIIRTVEELSGGRWMWSEGMLYPILHKLEEAGWISSWWQPVAGKRKRKYYRIEPAGRQALLDQRYQWLQVHGILEQTWPKESGI
ncbi:MAG: helix-turn-helix transcriptional regulator [Bacteroidetes bacterium]|nr:helix-turn-helix transcriptional regulator [Bacteroidota bacterium]